MVNEYGGKATAHRLLATNKSTEGFTELFLRGGENLRLSVEYPVLEKPWRDQQFAVARKRLVECGAPYQRAIESKIIERSHRLLG